MRKLVPLLVIVAVTAPFVAAESSESTWEDDAQSFVAGVALDPDDATTLLDKLLGQHGPGVLCYDTINQPINVPIHQIVRYDDDVGALNITIAHPGPIAQESYSGEDIIEILQEALEGGSMSGSSYTYLLLGPGQPITGC